MKNRCIVKHCPNKGVWWHGLGNFDVFCERHKDLGVAPPGRYGPAHYLNRTSYGGRLHEGRKTPRAHRDRGRWKSA
jgi:hypothetical protein